MTSMESRPVQVTQVYAQDTAPTDERDGVLWVDTSEPSRPVYAYSSDTGAWEPTSPGNVTISDTAPTGESEGHLWIDTSPAGDPIPKVLDSAGNWVFPPEAQHAADSDNLGGSPPATYIQDVATTAVSDLSASRSLATWYQNTTGNPLLFIITTFDSDGTDGLYVSVNDTQTENQISISKAGVASNLYLTTTVLVPANSYYYATATQGTIDSWVEQEIQVS